jgi:phage baseplate assembly protein W
MDGSRIMSSAIALPFSFDANGRILTTQDQKKIMQDRVVLAVMTLTSERVMRPSFGTRVRGTSFENYSSAIDRVKQEIAQGFGKMLPYLALLGVDTSIDPNDGNLNITINYKYGASQNPETVVVKTDILTQSGDVISEVPYGNK